MGSGERPDASVNHWCRAGCWMTVSHLGLEHGGDERTQREIAKELGISRSYVSRIEKRALMKLYHEFYKSKR